MAMRAATTGDTDTVDIYATGPWIRVGNCVLIGLDCGPVRLRVRRLSDSEVLAYERALREIGFFEWAIS